MAEQTPRRLSGLWDEQYTRFQYSRQRIAELGRWRRREVHPYLPQGWENPDAFRVEMPYATSLGQDVVSFLGRKRPQARRSPLGAGPTAERTSEKIETFIQEAMDHALRASGEDLWEAFLAHAESDFRDPSLRRLTTTDRQSGRRERREYFIAPVPAAVRA